MGDSARTASQLAARMAREQAIYRDAGPATTAAQVERLCSRFENVVAGGGFAELVA